MYFAHAGHEHAQEINTTIQQPLLIAGAVILVVVVISVLVVFDIRRKRAAETVSKK